MSGTATGTVRRGLHDFLLPWACLALAGAFWGWMLTGSVEELLAPEAAARRVVAVAGPAAAAAGAVAGGLAWFGARATLARAVFGSALLYLACIKIAGVALAPGGAAAAALVVAVSVRTPPPLSSALLVLHAMGTMAGVHMVFALPRYLSAAAPFRDVLRSLWYLL